MQVDFWENGKCEKRTLLNAMRDNWGAMMNRISAPHVVLFPFLAKVFVT